MSLSLLLKTKRPAFLRWMERTNFWPKALCQQYLQVVQMMEYFVWYLSWGRTSRTHWSIHAARASIEIPMSSDLMSFLLEFLRLKFRIFAGEETVLQQISALPARLGAKRVTATWYQESLVRNEANGTVASEVVNLSAKWCYQGNEIATKSSWVEWWGSEDFQCSWTLIISDIVTGLRIWRYLCVEYWGWGWWNHI